MCINDQCQVEASCNCTPQALDGASTEAPRGSFHRLRSRRELTSSLVLFRRLGIFDRLLTPLILVSMVVGVLIGDFVPGVQAAFDTVKFDSVSVREQPIHSID